MSGQHVVSGGHRLGRAFAKEFSRTSSPNAVSRHTLSPHLVWARRIALMAAVAVFAIPEAANAQTFWGWGPRDYYPRDYYPRDYYYDQRPYDRRPVKPRRAKRKADPAEAAAKKAAKPVGPLVIAVSVEKQRVKVYDSNGLFAEARVSTGTKSHPTPYGVFSIIQKNRHHVSNLYGASMPYMQRITWSGVAMHTGPLPGYAASHGCIRLPNDFAARLWTWTKMGTRVIVAPGEVSPASFSHPKLVAKMVPLPKISAAPIQVQVAATANVAASEQDRAAMAQQRTADAREAVAQMKGTLSDAPPPVEAKVAETRPVDTAQAGADKPTDASDLAVRPQDRINTDESATTVAAEPAKADEEAVAPKASEAKPTPAQEIAQPSDIVKPTDIVKPADVAAPAVTPEPAGPAVVATPRRHNHVAVFISRKDRKLYVRHGYEPVFDTPVEIADADRPLGTHVFTARGDKDDSTALHWSVVSLPQVARRSQARRAARQDGRKPAAVQSNVIAPLSASEALDRIAIPSEALEKIASIITPGGSLLISDHGLNGWETGRGTDFIVPLR